MDGSPPVVLVSFLPITRVSSCAFLLRMHACVFLFGAYRARSADW